MAAIVGMASATAIVVRRWPCVWKLTAVRSISTTSILFKTYLGAKNVKLKDKLPPPHMPVSYPKNWKYPKHDLTQEDIENYEPPKLLMVRRVLPLKHRFAWEKYILTQLRIHEKTSDIAIVKNTPAMNLTLWKVKHLIQVKPITFPNGLPERGDYTGTYLKPNGEFIVNKKLKVGQKDIEWPEEYVRKRFDPNYMRQYLLVKWQQKLDF